MQTQNILHHTIRSISFQDWASASTLLNRGFPQDEILNILGVELPIWHQAIEQWNILLEKHQELAARYGEIYRQPFIGKFEELKQENSEVIHPKIKNLDNYYKVFCHIEEVQNHGIDFLTVLEKHHQLSWEEWSEIQTKFLSYELNISNKGSMEAKKQLQLNIQSSTDKWQQYWKAYYKDQNLNLTTDINF